MLKQGNDTQIDQHNFMLTESKIKMEAFDGRGWILGPREDAKALVSRVEILEYFFSNPPETIDYFLTDRDWEGALERIRVLYDAKPDWIVAHYDNNGLTFFQGAATWIVCKDDLRVPLIQLRKSFDSGSHLKLYSCEEVLAHEVVHAMRMQFDEPKFEEIFAYKTSRRLYRRLMGPLFQKPWEANLFLLILLIPIATEVYAFFYPEHDWVFWLTALPAFFGAWLLGRLVFYQLVLHIALKKLRPILKQPQKAWAVALRLSDREIFRIAFSKMEQFLDWVSQKKTARWILLSGKFFKKKHDCM